MTPFISASLLASLIVCSPVVYSHGGPTDSTGGHKNNKTGEYHCHREPCFSNQKKRRETTNLTLGGESYNRKDWPHWIDMDGDCQNERAEALIAASLTEVKFKRDKNCVVSQGKWFDPYSGGNFTDARKLDIDHIIPLKEAHISGGNLWNREQRRIFANDPENLLVVSARENREKGAKDPAKWLPDSTSYHCEYVRTWLRVKTKYALAIDLEEKDAINAVLV
jgi:hypothetical protein